MLVLVAAVVEGGGSSMIAPSGKAGSAGTQAPQPNSCAEQRRLYVDYRSKLIQDRVDRGCSADAECALFEDLTGCSPACTFAIPATSRRGIDDPLYAFAAMTYSRDCPPPPVPPCAPRPSAACVQGRCLEYLSPR